MKGDTIEVINTDAEGRLVLADVLWYAQERFKPRAIIDLATLTGAIIIALGHEKAGVFANDDALADAFLAAAEAEGEGAWRMPLAPAYDKLLKSRIADVANVGGRPAGSVTAAQFLQRFVKDGHALGAPRHRRGRLCLARTASSRRRARPAGACARSTGWSGTATRADADGRGAASTTSPPSPLEASLPEMLEKVAGARLAGGRCAAAPRPGMAALDARALDLPRRRLPAARHRRRRPRGAAAGLPDARRREPERRQRADAGRRRPRRRRPRWRGFERTCLIFDGGDERAVEAARDDWRAVRAAGLAAVYWAQEHGRWVQKAAASA